MTRYGYARVSTREQNTASQYDALVAAGITPEHVVIEKVSGKLASRPQLDQLLERLQPGDQVAVTRLRRIGRSHQHLLDLSAWSKPTRPSSTGWRSARAPGWAGPRPGPAAGSAAARLG